MREELQAQGRSFWIALAILLLVGVFLGVRSQRAMRTVLSPHNGTAEVQAVGSYHGNPDLLALAARDSVLQQAAMGERDPFGPPPPKRSPEPPRPRPKPKPKPPPRPVVRVLLFDEVDPTVQLAVNGESSGWLHIGDTFHGWTIDEITATTVTVSQGEETIVLR